MSNICLLPKQSLPFYCPHKVTLPPSLRSLQPNSAFHVNWVAMVSWRKVGDLRTSLPPDISPCSCSLQTPFDPHPLRTRFLKCFSRKNLIHNFELWNTETVLLFWPKQNAGTPSFLCSASPWHSHPGRKLPPPKLAFSKNPHSSFPRTFWVLALKALHPGNLLSSIQTGWLVTQP